MSQLFVITSPALVPGFHLAGVNAYGIEDVKTAQELIEKWMADGEAGLLAIDNSLLDRMDEDFLQRLASSEKLLYVGIPARQQSGSSTSRTDRVTALIRQAIGFHITLKSDS